jgi:hypothetical protein
MSGMNTLSFDAFLGMPPELFDLMFPDELSDTSSRVPFAVNPWLTIITGHYGVGKTNLSLNIARDLRVEVPRVTLIDLDIVNPYFRSTDNKAFLDAHDIKVLGPVHGASNLDTPSLSPGIDEAIMAAGADHAVVIDVGGDPDGARALGRYAEKIAARPHRVVFVVNLRRLEAGSVTENLELLRGIEVASGLTVTELLGNTHLKELTTAQTIAAAFDSTQALAETARLPLVGIAVPRPLAEQGKAEMSKDHGRTSIYPVDIIVATPWESSVS